MIKFDTSKYYYDSAAAEKVIKFIESFCRHIRGDLAGQLIKLDEWQKEDIIKPVFGIKKLSNNKRRFKTIYVEIPKGNAKSTLGSSLALYLLGFDNQGGAEVYGAAGDTHQARIIFETATNMVKEDETLSTVFESYQYSIRERNTANSYRVISSEAKTKHGFNPSAIIFDELHVQPNRELWDTLTAGQMKRDESLCLAFTTAGFDKQSICWELHEKTEKVNAGILTDESFLGLIYTVDQNADISDPKIWKKANPGLGTIITYDNLAIEYAKVKANPSYENTFRRLHLNQWTETYESWIQDSEWMSFEPNRSVEELTGKMCYGGLDLAATRDFNSLVLVFPDGEKVDVLVYFWLPKDMLDKRMERMVDFGLWVKDGLIKQTAGESVDYDVILNDIRELSKKYNIKSVSYDRKFAAPIVTSLNGEVLMRPFDQSIANISYPTKQLDVLSAKRKVNHFGNPVLRWMLSNVKIYRDANDNIKVTKAKSTDKVDGVVALIMAIGEWETNKMQGESIYATRGVITI